MSPLVALESRDPKSASPNKNKLRAHCMVPGGENTDKPAVKNNDAGYAEQNPTCDNAK